MSFRYYNAERIREKMPEFRGTDEELQSAFDDISLIYNSAIKELKTKLDIISDDFDKKHSYMPIHHISTRLKNFDSLIEKAARYGIEDPINNLDVVRREVLDIAGIRVICNYEEDIDLIRMKDYCDSPKESGYRSLHMVVSTPVYLVNRKVVVPVELQFRSIAMDLWASLEHELRYKNKGLLDDEVQNQLKECAETLTDIDHKMSKIRNKVLSDDNEYLGY